MINSDLITMPDEWKLVHLGDIAEIRSGNGFPLSKQGRRSGQYPFIKVSDMTLNGNEIYISNANNFVDKRDVEELKATIFPPGTIVFPKVGAAIATNKKRALKSSTIIDNNMIGVTISDNSRCDTRFLHAWFESIDLTSLANVSAVPSITSSRLKRERILLPPLSEQRNIAAIIDSIDEAIERINAVVIATEGLRDALLHALLTRGVPGWHSEWKSVPSIGVIPIDWKVVNLGEICDPPKYGAALRGCPFDPDLPRYVRITDITDDGRLRTEEPRSVKLPSSSEHELRLGDLLFARSGSVGRTYLYRSTDGHCIFAGYLIRFRPNPKMALPEFVSIYTHSIPYLRWVASMRRIGAQPNINAMEYSSLPIPLPSLLEQRTIVALFDAIEKSLAMMKQELLQLTNLKASMLDSLLTGKFMSGTEVN